MIFPEANVDEVLVMNTAKVSEATSMKLNGKAFQIMSSGLYKDRILAIIRELCTNAWDAHVAAGNSADFDVYLPTAFKPQFRIRDYGTGMDEHTMFTVFNCMFESTKTGTNEQSGMLGLGSKSPFAYTNMVQVISYQSGRAAFYNLFLDKTGLPMLSKLAEAPTTEPDGLEVSFSVTTQDFLAFEQKALIVQRAFIRGPRPIFHGMKTTEMLEELIPGVWTHPSGVGNNRYFALQGNVAYPIDLKIPDLKARFGAVYFEFPIGSLDFTPSREELTDSKANEEALDVLLKEKCGLIIKHYEQHAGLGVAAMQVAYNDALFQRLFLEAVKDKVDFPIALVIGGNYSHKISNGVADLIEVKPISRRYRDIALQLDANNDSAIHVRSLSYRLNDTAIIIVDDKKYWRKRLDEHNHKLAWTNLIIVNQLNGEDISELQPLMDLFKTVRISTLPAYVPKRTASVGPKAKPYSWFREIDDTGVCVGLWGNYEDFGYKPGDKVWFLTKKLNEVKEIRRLNLLPKETKILYLQLGAGRSIPDDLAKRKAKLGDLQSADTLLTQWAAGIDWDKLRATSKAVFDAADGLHVLFEHVPEAERSQYFFCEEYWTLRDAAKPNLYDELHRIRRELPNLYNYSKTNTEVYKLEAQLRHKFKLVSYVLDRGQSTVSSFRDELLSLLKKPQEDQC